MGPASPYTCYTETEEQNTPNAPTIPERKKTSIFSTLATIHNKRTTKGRKPIKQHNNTLTTYNQSLKTKTCNTALSKQGLPLPHGRGVCETKSKNGRSRPRKPFISRVFCAQRGVETMVSDHGLGRGQTMGRGRSGNCEAPNPERRRLTT